MVPDHKLTELIADLLAREGGYVNHPADRGGPTNMGITLKALSAHRGHQCTHHDVIALNKAEAAKIYELEYWIKPGFDRLRPNPVVAGMLFDTSAHSGAGTAVRLLQQAIGVKVDGILGPVTATCANRLDPPHLAALFIGERVSYLGELITRDPSQAVFAAGWMNRMRDFIVQVPIA